MTRDSSIVLAQAETLQREGRPEEAIGLLKTTMDDVPDDLLVRVRLADYLRRDGRTEEAIALYKGCALQYADQGALPFAIALYKVLVPLSRSQEGEEEAVRSLLREIVRRYEGFQQKAGAGLLDEDIAARAVDIPLFDDLSRDELEEVVRGIVPLRMGPDSVICKEGEEGSSIFIVTRGVVRVWASRDGARQDLARLGPGDFFGEWSLITGDYKRHAWVEAETEVELLELTEDVLDTISEAHPRVREVLSAFHRRRRLDTLLAQVFPTLNPVERRKFAEKLQKEEHYPRGTVVYAEGDQSFYMSIIQQGTVEVYTTNLDGVRLTLAILGPGQYFGEGGALSGSPRTASVRARTDLILHNISRVDLVTALASHPEILNSLHGVRVERIGDTIDKLEGVDEPLPAASVDGKKEEV